MSNTPLTDMLLISWDMDVPSYVMTRHARFIELKLNAANERIKRLEEDLMDAKNQYAVLVADVALYEDRGERIKRLEKAGNAMCKEFAAFCPIGAKTRNMWRKAKEAK